VTDALGLAGHPAPAHLSATEVAHAAAAAANGRLRPPLSPVAGLADLVNRRAFAPEATGEEHARVAAREATAYTRGLRAAQPWWRRALWPVHPAPLLRRRR
jgi:hypothetical protein